MPAEEAAPNRVGMKFAAAVTFGGGAIGRSVLRSIRFGSGRRGHVRSSQAKTRSHLTPGARSRSQIRLLQLQHTPV